jgi:hypothetical protein
MPSTPVSTGCSLKWFFARSGSVTRVFFGQTRCQRVLDGLKMQSPQSLRSYPAAQVENLYPHHAPFGIKIENDTRLYLLRFNDCRLVQPKVQRITFLVYLESHLCLPSLLSKKSVTIRLG